MKLSGRLKYIYVFWLIYSLTLLFNIHYIFDMTELIIKFTGDNNAANLFTGNFGVIFLSVTGYICLPFLLLIKPVRKISGKRVTISGFFIFILFLISAAPSLFTSATPTFFPDKSGYRLLPPFSVSHYTEKEAENISFADMKKNFIKFKSLYSKEYYGFETINFPETENIQTQIYFLGTDNLGRDLYSLIIHGTRVSLFIAFMAVLLAGITGTVFGFISGYRNDFRGKLPDILSDLFLAFPGIFFILLLTAFFSSDLAALIIILGLTGWMGLFKIIRTEVNGIKRTDFFKTARIMGFSKYHLIFREIFPVILAPVIVNLTFLAANIILAEAALSYLGVDFGTDYPTWGQLIDQGQHYIRNAWWVVTGPSVMLSVTIIAFYKTARKMQEKFYFNI